ncbi:MAG: hypothetical protein QM704_05920 [Anaeromyxobacteraceae bacterium]
MKLVHRPPGGLSPITLSYPVVATVRLPVVRAVTPWAVAAGDLTPVRLHGLNLDQAVPGGVTLGGAPIATEPTPSADAATAVPPVLAPGAHAVSAPNALALDLGGTALHVVAVGPRAAASGPSQAGERAALVRDDVRGATYAANTGGWLERWRDAAGHALEKLPFPALRGAALTPDGATLLVLAGEDLWEVDPAAFTKPSAPVASLSSWHLATGTWRLAMAADGIAILGPSNSAWAGTCLRYVVRTQELLWGGGCGADSEADLAASRDGERIVFAAGTEILTSYDASGGGMAVKALAANVPVFHPVLDRTGRRYLPSTVGAGQLRDENLDPIPGTLGAGTLAAALSDGGDRVFTWDASGKVRVWDVSAPVADGGTYPEVGLGVTPVALPGANPRAALSVDGKTLYLVGDTALVVVPLP